MKNLASLIEKLVSYQTTSDNPSENLRCLKFIKGYLKLAGIKTKIHQHNATYSLVGSTKLKKHYKLVLFGHIDVVPAKPSEFNTRIKGNKLFGRGTADMKGTVAVMLKIIKEFASSHHSNRLAIILTSDEEVGGFNGAHYLVNKLGYTADCVFLPDTDPGYKLLTEAKGVLHLRLNARGKLAHGATPWLGDNAIDKLINAYTSIKESLSQNMSKNHWNTTINLGKISGGDATNTVAQSASLSLDFRYPPTTDKSKLMNCIRQAVSKYKGVKTTVLLEGNPVRVDAESIYVSLIKKIVKKHTGKPPKFVKEHGSSDARFFSAKRIPVIMLNPITSDAHIDNEWIDLKRLPTYVKIIKDFAKEVLSG